MPRPDLQLAALADVDPRTAAKWLRGEEVRGRPGQKLADAARQLGVTPPSSPNPEQSR